MAIHYGRLAVWGNMACPILPKGFVLKRKPNGLAKAVRKGVEHVVFLKPNQLAPVMREWAHNTQCDFERAISF